MSARALRRTFATPFVFTLAAVPAACMSSNPPSPSSPNQAASHDEHEPGHVNPPKPAQTHWEPSSTSTTPPPATQTPPVEQAPQAQTGTNDHVKGTASTSSTTASQSQPAPGAGKVDNARGYRQWTVTRAGSKCSSMVKVHCPEGAMCNPPPPAKYECPKALADNGRLDIIQHADKGECFVDTGDFECPKPQAGVAVSCNPPRPQKVTCPK